MIEVDVPLPTLEVMGGWKKLPTTYLATLGDGRPSESIASGSACR